ncbi:hypothetical protein EF903_02470 [Streptomyces sp. WAC05292]|nr:hypothetical protein EF903_02470 [Streptomyces sp. WAC05292]
MGEVDLGHATAAEHVAQLVPAAEATRLFHNVPALSVSPDRTRVWSGGVLFAQRLPADPR